MGYTKEEVTEPHFRNKETHKLSPIIQNVSHISQKLSMVSLPLPQWVHDQNEAFKQENIMSRNTKMFSSIVKKNQNGFSNLCYNIIYIFNWKYKFKQIAHHSTAIRKHLNITDKTILKNW